MRFLAAFVLLGTLASVTWRVWTRRFGHGDPPERSVMWFEVSIVVAYVALALLVLIQG